MNYIVLDLEWNQPYGAKGIVRNPVILQGEIIQIGAVKLSEDYQITDTFKIMVKPICYRKMHKKVIKLTSISDEDLQYGFQFPKAFKHFKKWCGEEFCFLTWGQDDVSALRDNMLLHKMNPEWIPQFYNLQVIYRDQISKDKLYPSLLHAMQVLEETGFSAHDALNDAWNTVQVCRHLDMRKGIAEYQTLLEQMECEENSAVKSSKIDRTFQTKAKLLAAPELLSFSCPYCGIDFTCNDLVKHKGSKYISTGQCANGDGFFIKFRIRREWDGFFSVNRLLYDINEDYRNLYEEKKKKEEEFHATRRQGVLAELGEIV